MFGVSTIFEEGSETLKYCTIEFQNYRASLEESIFVAGWFSISISIHSAV